MVSSLFLTGSATLFFLGTILGSFLNVMICRSANEEDWKVGRSRCDHCKTMIAWYDNIPIFSFLLLRGKCRACHKPIALSHIVVEFLTGALFVWWYWFGFLFFQLSQTPYSLLQPFFWLFVGVVLLVIFIADWRYFIIPDGAVVILALSTLLYRLSLAMSGVMQWQDFFNTIYVALGATLFFFSLWFFTKGKGMGFGDVKVIGPLCVLMGWQRSLVGVLLSFMLGAGVGVLLLATGKKKMRQPIPFGPFLIAAVVISLLWGDSLSAWYVGLVW